MATALANVRDLYHKDYFKVCNRFYIKGECPRAERCYYRHVVKEEVFLEEKPTLDKAYVFGQLKKPAASNTDISHTRNSDAADQTPVCRFFLRGYCRFGNNCWYSHQPTQINSSVKNKLNSSKTSSSQPTSSSTSNNWDNNIPTSSATRTANDSASFSICNNYLNCSKVDCKYLHGDICDVCGLHALHPFNKEEREKHSKDCIKKQEQSERSKEKSCGVCFEVVMEKSYREKTFGILPNCSHCFCLSCIRKWRKSRQFEDQIIRACPECRVTSDFVCPSKYWVDTKEEKEELIMEYKQKLGNMNCKYFSHGRGRCPFGNKCFYLHALPDGTKKDVGPPRRKKRRVPRNEEDLLQQFVMMDFALWDDSDNGFLRALAHFDDLVPYLSDDDSDMFDDSDYIYDDTDDDFDYVSFTV